MRDDLHKSYPPRHAWGRVLHLAENGAPAHELSSAIVRAVQKDADWMLSGWGRAVERALEMAGQDMFAREKAQAEMRALLPQSPNVHARGVCQVALGCLARGDDLGLNFRETAIRTALNLFAGDCIEQVASRVAQTFGHEQARQVREVLSTTLPSCDFTSAPAPRKRVRAEVEDGLNMALELAR